MDRVPHFGFVDREHGVDSEKSIEMGYEVPNIITIIQVRPHGHNGDPMEFEAEKWIEQKGREAREGRYPHAWVSAFKEGLSRYREGREIPREGTPLILWERILKSRREQLAARYPTLEDLAAVPDSALGEIGMDGRVLRDMAVAELQAKRDLSPLVKEVADLREDKRRLEEVVERLEGRLEALEKRRGRPPQVEEAA
jgi:hypothetical protein